MTQRREDVTEDETFPGDDEMIMLRTYSRNGMPFRWDLFVGSGRVGQYRTQAGIDRAVTRWTEQIETEKGKKIMTKHLYTVQDAETELRRLGFTWNAKTFEWVRDNTRGKLTWVPDYSQPDNYNVGTEFTLSLGLGGSRFPVLPRPDSDNA